MRNAKEILTFADALVLPPGIATRSTPDEVAGRVADVLALKAAQPRRNYLLGVLIAYVGVAESLLAQVDKLSIEDVFKAHPPRDTLPNGAAANTLTFGEGESLISLRTHYNAVERVIRHDLNRPHYPNSAPHATQSWTQHRREFELIAAMSPHERSQLLDELWDQVLEIPVLAGDSDAVREVRPFEFILDNFASTARGEPGGAVLQGLAYAYYRADSPTVTLRVYKVGSGSSRVGAAGDVDGWIGRSLALSVEVKDLDISNGDLSQFDQFVKQLARWPNCTAVVLARSISQDASQWLAERSILTLDRHRMSSNVAYWDLPKQRMAVREFHYYLSVIQGNAKLIARFETFCSEHEIQLDS